MRLLLDQNLPKRRKGDFPNHEVFTVHDKGWNGFKNGELLQRMLADNFQALLTFDKNLQHQQNFSKYTITVFVLGAAINTYKLLTELARKVNEYLSCGIMPAGPIVIQQNASNAQQWHKRRKVRRNWAKY